MESSQFINQTRLSKKQLQLHVQQQNQNKYILSSPVHHHHSHDNNYTQQRCQHFAKSSPSSPPIPHFPAPPDYPPNHSIIFDQPSPSHHGGRVGCIGGNGGGIGKGLKKYFHQSDPNSIEVCTIDYENQQHNNVGVGNGKASSVSVCTQSWNFLFFISFSFILLHRIIMRWWILNNIILQTFISCMHRTNKNRAMGIL